MRAIVKYRDLKIHAMSEKGSTLFIVLGILTILAIMPLVLSYTTQLEVRAAGNFAGGIQARMASVAGIVQAINKYGSQLNLPYPGELSKQSTEATVEKENQLVPPISIALINVTDESAKININLPAYIHIDWEGTARDIMMDYFEDHGYYFRNL